VTGWTDATRPWLLSRAAATPEAPALVLESQSLSWAELAGAACGIADALTAAGVGPGDVVATLLGSADFARVVHGVWLRGATVLPVNLRLAEPEMAFQLQDAGARLLVASGDGRSEVLAARVPDLRVLSLCPDALPCGGPCAESEAGLARAPASQQPLAILYTSGTTGRAKGVVLSAGNFLASAAASGRHLGSRGDDRVLACMPLFHVGGLSILVRSLLQGSCVQVQEGFEPAAVVRALEGDGITDVSFVANMLARVLEARGGAKSPVSLRNLLVGGGPVPEPLLALARARGYPVAPTYGLTEATSQVATRAPGDDRAVGLRALPGVQLEIDGAGHDDRAEGEILVRGPTVMSGYQGRPEETARQLRGGWLHTGDIGRIHADGSLTVLDRRSDLIVSGGENVYPAEIESVLLTHPAVAEAGAGRRADRRFGSRPVAWLVPVAGASLSDDELARFCRERLAAFKVPVAFHIAERLPRTSAGKLKRSELVEPEPS
jgi:O-succinylbenzoic acid--CoA ligase